MRSICNICNIGNHAAVIVYAAAVLVLMFMAPSCTLVPGISSGCVREGRSLGPVSSDNTKMCCEGLVAHTYPNVIGDRGVCIKPEDKAKMACVGEGDELGVDVLDNVILCCPGLVQFIPPDYVGLRGVCLSPENVPRADYLSSDDCLAACTAKGYTSGSCMKPIEADSSFFKEGSCIVYGLPRCDREGKCNCYCRS